MIVLHVGSYYDQGIAGTAMADLHHKLQKKGVKSYVAYGNGEEIIDDWLWKFQYPFEYRWSRWLSRYTGMDGWFSIYATYRLIHRVKRLKPDLVHLHAIQGNFLNYRIFFRFLNQYSYHCIWTMYDCGAFTGKCSHFVDCRKWEHGCEECPDLKRKRKREGFDLIAWMWQQKKQYFTESSKIQIVTPSDWLGKLVEWSFLGKYNCLTIPNGIDAKEVYTVRSRRICRLKHGFKDKDRIVLGIASFYEEPRKGAKYMLQLAKELEEDPLVKVVLLDWKPAYDSLLEGHQNVYPISVVTNEDRMAEYYNLADVFVTTTIADAYSRAVLEAMGCGTPVVGFDCCGIAEQLSDGRGIAVPRGDIKALQKAVYQVMNAREGNESMTHTGDPLLGREELAKYIRVNCSREKTVTEYILLYRHFRSDFFGGGKYRVEDGKRREVKKPRVI